MCENNKNCRCIAEILTVIDILQQKAECNDACLETCDKGFLGSSTNCLTCNTRPVMLYTGCGNGTPWKMPVNKENDSCINCGCTSCVFRLEKLDGCCATFRVLDENKSSSGNCVPYVATNSFFTMNLECCCVLRCLPDTYVECI